MLCDQVACFSFRGTCIWTRLHFSHLRRASNGCLLWFWNYPDCLPGSARPLWEWLSDQGFGWHGLCWLCLGERSALPSLWSLWRGIVLECTTHDELWNTTFLYDETLTLPVWLDSKKCVYPVIWLLEGRTVQHFLILLKPHSWRKYSMYKKHWSAYQPFVMSQSALIYFQLVSRDFIFLFIYLSICLWKRTVSFSPKDKNFENWFIVGSEFDVYLCIYLGFLRSTESFFQ